MMPPLGVGSSCSDPSETRCNKRRRLPVMGLAGLDALCVLIEPVVPHCHDALWIDTPWQSVPISRTCCMGPARQGSVSVRALDFSHTMHMACPNVRLARVEILEIDGPTLSMGLRSYIRLSTPGKRPPPSRLSMLGSCDLPLMMRLRFRCPGHGSVVPPHSTYFVVQRP